MTGSAPALRNPVAPALAGAIASMEAHGHAVERQDTPGLYRVSGFPELTVAQMIGVAAALDLARPRA